MEIPDFRGQNKGTGNQFGVWQVLTASMAAALSLKDCKHISTQPQITGHGPSSPAGRVGALKSVLRYRREWQPYNELLFVPWLLYGAACQGTQAAKTAFTETCAQANISAVICRTSGLRTLQPKTA